VTKLLIIQLPSASCYSRPFVTIFCYIFNWAPSRNKSRTLPFYSLFFLGYVNRTGIHTYVITVGKLYSFHQHGFITMSLFAKYTQSRQKMVAMSLPAKCTPKITHFSAMQNLWICTEIFGRISLSFVSSHCSPNLILGSNPKS
jgi:hypothetical protein